MFTVNTLKSVVQYLFPKPIKATLYEHAENPYIYTITISKQLELNILNPNQMLTEFAEEIVATLAPDYNRGKEELRKYKELFNMLEITKKDKPEEVVINRHIDMYLNGK